MAHHDPNLVWDEVRGMQDKQLSEDVRVVLDEACIQALTKLASAKSREEAAQHERTARRALGAQRKPMRQLLDKLCERAADLERYQQLARVDELTGVANRRAFNASLRRELARARRSGRPLALLLLDLDGLKHINDHSGHMAGDRAISALAHSCSESVRASDLIARLGGDEFAVLLPDSDAEGAQATAQRIRQRAEDEVVAGGPLRVSIGWSVSDEYLKTPDALFSSADAALYRDKASRGAAR